LSWKKILIGFRPFEKLRKKQEREDAIMKWIFFFFTKKMKLLSVFFIKIFFKITEIFFRFFFKIFGQAGGLEFVLEIKEFGVETSTFVMINLYRSLIRWKN
jgi:hypothetical protein